MAEPLDADARPPRPSRVLVVLPNWVGDAVMATPALRVLRELVPGAFLGALLRPGIDDLLAGTGFFDEVHVGRAVGVMGPKRVAAKLRPRRYELAILLTNSFGTALITRIAGIPHRLGYDRDGRGVLLTEGLDAPKRRDVEPYRRSRTDPGAWAPVPASAYYFRLVEHALAAWGVRAGSMGPLELVATPTEQLAASDLLVRAGVPDGPLAIFNPGGSKPEKRWPAERFAALADYVAEHHGMTILLNGAPSEAELVAEIARRTRRSTRTLELPRCGITLSTLKGVITRCRVMVTNDTGPRHIAAAFGVPVVSLFGPTDPRWTTIPFEDEIVVVADPTLPPEEVTNDHPQRCAIDRIGLGDVVAAVNRLLTGVAAR